MARKRITIRQVAQRAGVSTTTVSFVLNRSALADGIPDETKRRVLEAAASTGYVADAAARTLASGRTRTLGLVLSDAHHLEIDAFIPRLLYSLAEVSNRHGFRVIVEGVNYVGDGNAYQALVDAKQIDGLVVLNPRTDDESLRELIGSGFPVVLAGTLGNANENSVRIATTAKTAVEHLVSLGHERIAHITFGPDAYRESRNRLEQYRLTLQEAGIKANDGWIRCGNFSADSGYQAMRSLLAEATKPTALFAGNDTIAIGAIAAIHEQGLRIPEDVAVVGYDDIPVAAFSIPALTTVRTPVIEQGRLAGEMLIEMVRGGQPPGRLLAPAPELIIRRSCGASHGERSN